MFIQKVLSFAQTLALSQTYNVCIDLIYTEIKTEVWISFSSFIKMVVCCHSKNGPR